MLELWYQTGQMAPRYKLGFEFTSDESGRLHADMFAMVIYEVMERLGHDKPIVRVTPQGLQGDTLAIILSDALTDAAEHDPTGGTVGMPANISFFPAHRVGRAGKSKRLHT